MISERFGPIPGTADRSPIFIFVSFDVSRRTVCVGTSSLVARDLPARPLPSARPASNSAAAVPDVPITSRTRSG